MKKSTQVAVGGVCTAMCLLLIFLTCLFPMTEFAFPAFAGMLLVVVVIENGYSTAVLVYVAVSLLALIVVPSKESALMFVGFFGYYPILKAKLEQIRPRFLEYFAKFFVFNVSVVASYTVLIYVFGLREILEESGLFGKYSLMVLILLGNVMFIVYDYAITMLTYTYTNWFRKRFLRRTK